jgi:hypothetical protein
MSFSAEALSSPATAVGGPLCGEQIAPRVRLWHCFDPDSEPRGKGSRNVGVNGIHVMAGDDGDLGRYLHCVIRRHSYLLPAAVIRGCYHRTVDEAVARYIDLRRDGDSSDQQRYRRLGVFTMYHASLRLFPKERLRRFNPELASEVRTDFPHDVTVQQLVDDYVAGHRN